MTGPLWPRSLVGQMALLIALALFVAQAINFTLALRERAAFRVAQATRPVATRIADALDREAQGARAIAADRGRLRRTPGNIIPAGFERRDDVAQELRVQLREAGVEVGRIDTGLRAWAPADAAMLGRRHQRVVVTRRADAPDQVLLIAVEQPGRGWLSLMVPWSDTIRYLFWRLFAQTLILYGVVLLPVLWIARRISRPLRSLTIAARDFAPGPTAALAPVREEGPADLRALTAAFNALRLRVTAMLDEKDRMLGAIGHDLRTPLAALRVRIESVEDEVDREKMVETIAEMNRTLDDILSLARLGRPSEPATDTDLAALVDAVVDDFRELEAAVTFEEAERLRVRLRPSLMRRAVRNLIENAIKYGGSADVSLVRGSAAARIVVADRGPGIPDHRLADVFDPFTRLEQSRNRDTGGIGLGLALTKAIVEEAGGSVTLTNRDDGGLIATIELPRDRP